MAEGNTIRDQCIFCKIVDGKEPNNIVHQDEELVVFPDRRPAAPHHYLVVSREHLRDAKSLGSQHKKLIENQVRVGLEVLQDQGGNTDTARLGYHWPPFHTVSHLHLHVIAPEAEMGFIARGIFKKDSFWFVSPEFVLERLSEKS
ncbi:adenosine 5'-monophosphoramidase HINT3-like isoform X2 [Oratosquilla oratoria]